MGDGKRRDAKGRILWTGETQESNGLYVYRYQDSFGRRKKLTSWRLTAADPTPKGKKDKEPLRDQEKAIQKLLDKGIDSDKLTVGALVQRYLDTRVNLSKTTMVSYRSSQAHINGTFFSQRQISSVKFSDAKLFCNELEKQGVSYSCIRLIHGLLSCAFKLAVEDRLVEYNPFSFKLADVVKVVQKKRDSITTEQKKDFLEFVKNDHCYCKYYDGFYILFGTGLRLGEFCGLTEDDVDFQNHLLTVDKQLMYVDRELSVSRPKTKAGVRQIPLMPDVEEAFHRVIAKGVKYDAEVDGVSGFLFTNSRHRLPCRGTWNSAFRGACHKYNETASEPLHITPHVCRHTFCSEMASRGVNVKVLQYLMGHSSFAVTMDIYTHVKLDDVRFALEQAQDKTLGQDLGQT